MTFQYFPTEEIIINDIKFTFFEDRKLVRSKLDLAFEENDKIISFGEVLPPISQRRDIYNNADSFFFLNYTGDDRLRDIEIHNCSEIKIIDIVFDFESDIGAVVNKLKPYSKDYAERDGEYIFFDLKMVVIDSERMGGEGNTLGYLYITTDITHLRD